MINNRTKTLLFPTPLYSFDVDHSLVDEIDRLIEEDYRFWFNAKPHISVSDDLQHQRKEKCIQSLNKVILSETQGILDDMKIKRNSHYITGMWHNVSSEPYRHQQHIHPNAFLSGILYVRAPKGCGVTEFSDPRLQKHVFYPDLTEMNLENTPLFSQPPRKGLVVVFPSWLQHSVDSGIMARKEKRITTAFNIHIHGESTLNTAKWKY